MDTESPEDLAYMSPEQAAWIKGELADTRDTARWTVVYGHRPLCVTLG